MEFTFPKGFQVGVASASAQIEGGDVPHNWNDWAAKGHILDHTSPRRANDHYQRWQEDIDLMHSMGVQIYRFSVEWARLEPQEGQWDHNAVAHYRQMIAYMKQKGIQPLLTLHHFTNPMWFENRGAFQRKENAEAFLTYVGFAVRAFGDLVSDYVTINEPNVYATQGYFGGGFPPGKNSMGAAIRVMGVLAGCHIRAYGMIHDIRREMGFEDTQVGFAHHMRVFAPLRPKNPWHRLCTRLTRWMFQGMVTKACLRGQFSLPMRNLFRLPQGEYADFLALNYYTRSSISGLADGMAKGVPVNDLGWEIYPHGIVECAQQMHDCLPRPIYVTENGTCDNTDAFRSLYLCQHWAEITASGLPFQRYYHWCFTDNFEWLEGESARFGLVHVDYDTQQRTVKRSGHFVTAAIQSGGVSQALYDEFVAGEAYHT